MRFGGKAYTKFIQFWKQGFSGGLAPKALSAQSKTIATLVAHKFPKGHESPPRPLEVRADDCVRLGERLVVHGSGELTEAVRVTDSEGQSSAADLYADGAATFAIQGRSRQGEEGNVQICRILIERVNRDGAHWGDPTTVKDLARQEVDCEARDGNEVLEIQVTRAEINEHIWKTLSRDRDVSGGYRTADEAADALRDAIIPKGNMDKSRRAKLILALDATETASHAFRPVVDSFRRRYGEWARQLCFKGIWVVGPTADLTSRLDSL